MCAIIQQSPSVTTSKQPTPTTMAEMAYVLITPDPRHWQPLNPTVAQLPGAPPNGVVNAVGTNFYVKIGDQNADGHGAIDAYKRANPSFFWVDVVIQQHNGFPNDAGKTLENMIFGQVLPGAQVFKHIGHGEEWYYCFNNHGNLMNFINACLANGDDHLTYIDVHAAYNDIQHHFRTA
ncbi:hypothetical protein PC9H_003124 [Pleurotus ostreatus]|uniref:Uncharacterized protein n=1 Tax=Pleurotus ostreatus TaxID=5322 RepID=A0A8H7DV20_PLEOS|nr:uncharacterized protein PC9H_003124 [Pleurotus ostreatus]KAF7436295.1 hypothetical protein PC9H_003124 [Pleurotus ostreatus]KAJ8701962.1 hypothetical protein PTI98_000712 [Pleurotus ostreatus]